MLAHARTGRAHAAADAHLPTTLPDAHARIRNLTTRTRRDRQHHLLLLLQRAIRDELITLVNTGVATRWFANRALARLGLPPLPGGYLVGATIPVTVTVDAPHDSYAAHVAAAQVVTELRGLHHAHLRGPTPSGKPAADPVQEAVRVVQTTRLATRPNGRYRRYTITATVRLAIGVRAPDTTTAWDAARQVLRADLRRLRVGFVAVHLDQMRKSWVRSAGTCQLTPGTD